MKKIFLFLLLLIPISVKANDIENYKIDMTVLEDGSVLITEAFKMNNIYNGIEREIRYKDIFDNYYSLKMSSTNDSSLYNCSSVTLNEIRGINFNEETDLKSYQIDGDLFILNNSSLKGDYGTYKTKETDNSFKYIIYNHSRMNKDYYLSYTLNNAVIIHEDISELFLNLIDKIDSPIKNLEVYINIPTNKSLLYVWGHQLDQEIIDNQTIKLTGNNVNKSVDFRIVFDASATKSNKYSKTEALDTIREIEMKTDLENSNDEYEKIKSETYDLVLKAIGSKNIEDYNTALFKTQKLKDDDFKYDLENRLSNLLDEIDLKNNINKTVLSIIIILWLGGLFIIFPKNNKTSYKEKYCSDLPDYSPAVLAYLLRRKINKNDLIASVLYLIDNGVISYKNNKLINNSKENDNLLKLIFKDEKSITLSNFKKRTINNPLIFLGDYSNWINKTIASIENKYYEDTLIIKIVGIIYSVLGITLGILFYNKNLYINSICLIVFGFIFLIYYILYFKRTRLGNNEVARWEAIKRFMNKYEITDEMKPYAITLKIKTNTDNKIKTVFDEMFNEIKKNI